MFLFAFVDTLRGIKFYGNQTLLICLNKGVSY